MTGKNLRERLNTLTFSGKKINFTSIAKKLGMERQAFNSKLNAKRMDDDFVMRIAEVLKIPLTTLTLGIDDTSTIEEPNAPYMTEYQTKYMLVLEENSTLSKKHISVLEKHIVLQSQLINCHSEKEQLLRDIMNFKTNPEQHGKS